jgi:hypothetical protein
MPLTFGILLDFVPQRTFFLNSLFRSTIFSTVHSDTSLIFGNNLLNKVNASDGFL